MGVSIDKRYYNAMEKYWEDQFPLHPYMLANMSYADIEKFAYITDQRIYKEAMDDIQKRWQRANEVTIKYWEDLHPDCSKSTDPVVSRPPVEIDHHGLIWKQGKVFLNTFKATIHALKSGIANKKIEVKECWGTAWNKWTINTVL